MHCPFLQGALYGGETQKQNQTCCGLVDDSDCLFALHESRGDYEALRRLFTSAASETEGCNDTLHSTAPNLTTSPDSSA